MLPIMETIKKTSRGDLVRLLQRRLGTPVVDGIFGDGTLAAVRAFQQKNGLSSDGVVGDKTWAKLLGFTIDIKDAHINTHITRMQNRPLKYIAIHYTAGRTSKGGSAMNTRSVFLNRNASADFVVDDTQIVRITPDVRNCYCWAVGDKKNVYTGGGQLYGIAANKNTISIEICSNLKDGYSAMYANHEGWYFSEAALTNALCLVKYLMWMYDIPKQNVVRHYDVSGKICPAIIGWNDATIYDNAGKPTVRKNDSNKWKLFLARL